MQYYCAVLFCVGVYAKDLHIKESIDTGIASDVDRNINDFYHYDDNVYTEKERYARHVELVTETVLDHLLNEIKRKYPGSRNETRGIPKMVKRLKMKLKQINKKKLKKHRVSSHKKHSDDSSVTTPQQGTGTTSFDNYFGSLV